MPPPGGSARQCRSRARRGESMDAKGAQFRFEAFADAASAQAAFEAVYPVGSPVEPALQALVDMAPAAGTRARAGFLAGTSRRKRPWQVSAGTSLWTATRTRRFSASGLLWQS